MSAKYSSQLLQFSKLVKDEINIIQNGGKLSSFKRQIKSRQKQLKAQLNDIIVSIASTGVIHNDWIDIRNLFIIRIRQLLDSFNDKYKDSKTFQEQKEVILQYFVFFEKPPFTCQRIAELILHPEKFYRSTKKILYAFEKLVNVGDPDDR